VRACVQPVDARRVAAARRQFAAAADDGGGAAGGARDGLGWRGRFFADAAAAGGGRNGGDVTTPAHPAVAALPPPGADAALSAPLRAALGLAPGAPDPLAERAARFGPPPALGDGGDAAAAAAAATPGGGLHALRCNRAYADNGALSAIVASFDAGCAGHGRDGAVGLFHLPAPLADALLLTPLFLPPPPPPPPPA
jgi:hypothetical protein